MTEPRVESTSALQKFAIDLKKIEVILLSKGHIGAETKQSEDITLMSNNNW